MTKADRECWVSVVESPLPLLEILNWAAQRRDCGALAAFFGMVRDHSESRDGVVSLEYEAYPEQVTPRLVSIADEIRSRWPHIGRVALLHRIGQLSVGEVSVAVAVSTPHRHEAFEAARFGIDTIKMAVPIWKRETWLGGSDWSLCSHPIIDSVAELSQ